MNKYISIVCILISVMLLISIDTSLIQVENSINSMMEKLENMNTQHTEDTPEDPADFQIPTEYMESVAMQIEQARQDGFLDGCIYAIENMEVFNELDGAGTVFLSLDIDDGGIEQYGVVVHDFVPAW